MIEFKGFCTKDITDHLIANDDESIILNKEGQSKPPEEFSLALEDFFKDGKVINSTVLGIDIYKYSKYNIKKQNYIPFIFNHLYEKTVNYLIEKEKYLFQGYSFQTIKKQLIPTGDGGFQILDTPLHAIIFAIYFETFLRLFNSCKIFPKLRDFIEEELTLRYALTYDNIFHFDDNYYGPAIITNARILSQDKLNRFLVDSKANKWFLNNLNGVESLQVFNLADIINISDFDKLDNKIKESKLIRFEEGKYPIFRSINISKLRTIEAKETHFDVFNLQVQVRFTPYDEDKMLEKEFVITIGNLNTEGINI